MKKNIWILNHYGLLGEGRHYKFAYNLAKRGYNVKIFVASTRHNSNINRIIDNRKYIEEEMAGVTCIYIKARNYIGNGKQRLFNILDYAKGLLSISKKFDKEKPDIILASSVHPLTWLSGYILSKRYKAKFIAETRDLWPETLVIMGQLNRKSIPAKILYKLEKFIYKKADRLIFTFPGGKEYVSNIGLDNSKVRYINNGVDISEFYENKDDYIFKDPDLDNKDTFKVLFTGAIGRANAIYNVVETAKILSNKGYKDIKMIIFGDGPEREKLEKYVSENHLDNIVFKGRVNKQYIPSILTKSDINLFTVEHLPNLLKYGMSPNKLFDYFASGKPTLSNVECGYDMIKEYESGLVVKGSSIDELVEGILHFYNMPKEEYDKYCQNALRAAEDFDFNTLTDKLEEIILELIPEEEGYANTIN